MPSKGINPVQHSERKSGSNRASYSISESGNYSAKKKASKKKAGKKKKRS